MSLILILLAIIAFIVLATTKFKVHPFLALLLAAFLGAFAYGLPADTIAKTITTGFGGILGYIGLVIVLGTIIGVILEKAVQPLLWRILSSSYWVSVFQR